MPIVGQFGSLAGLGSLILPGGAIESIATITVGSGGASSIEFTSISGSYQHLQLRMIYRNTSTGSRVAKLTVNSDTGSNYAAHNLFGTGAATGAEAYASQGYIWFGTFTLSTDTASSFTGAVVDLLDYANTSKNKTVRYLAGRDHNGSGLVMVGSGLWMSTSAVTSVKLAPVDNNFAQHTTAALYGIKAP